VNDHIRGPSLLARYQNPPGVNDFLTNTLGFAGLMAIKAYPRVWDSCCNATSHQFNQHFVGDTQVCCKGARFGASPPYERNDACCGTNQTTHITTGRTSSSVWTNTSGNNT
jgi:hypothetical protein